MNEAQLRYEKSIREAKEIENEKLRNTLSNIHFTNKLLWGALAIESVLVLVLSAVLFNG